ncbi:hypothetical protein [Phenylobacterium sp.]|uniref:hypothetical protein n=1 Tax=Phenylobacterium sp. TaxID=1871053 RepID=UPI00273274B6|nr:hypothetical protein [Phenylobacterium sp.]MDP3854498.1 hypothetical protein [Phenylobacterium sp.]
MTLHQPGQTYRGIQCKGCGVTFPLADQSEEVNEPVLIPCPRCKAVLEYQPADIQSLLAHRKQ